MGGRLQSGSRLSDHEQKKPDQQEIERLRREVTILKAERDILEKAAAFFAKDAT